MQSLMRWYIGKFSNYIWSKSWYLPYFFFLNVLPKNTACKVLLIGSRVNRFSGGALHKHLFVLLISKTEVTDGWTCRTNIVLYSSINFRSQWPRGLRCRSTSARLLRLWVRIPPGAWISVCCECCVLSRRGLCDELITRPEESYRLWCVVVCDLEKTKLVNEEGKAH